MPGFLRRALTDDVQHRVDTVLNVEITFPLQAVAENFQAAGMLQELFIKIKNVAVRIALAEDRDKAENIALEFEAFAIGRNHAFAGNFGRSVERSLDWKRRVFRRGNFFGLRRHKPLPVELKAMRLTPLARMASRTLKVAMVFCCKSLLGCSRPKRTSALAAQMENHVAARHRLGERRQIKVVAFDKFEAGIFQRIFHKSLLAGGEIVPANDGFSIGEQAVNQTAADKTRRTGDKNFFHNSGTKFSADR